MEDFCAMKIKKIVISLLAIMVLGFVSLSLNPLSQTIVNADTATSSDATTSSSSSQTAFKTPVLAIAGGLSSREQQETIKAMGLNGQKGDLDINNIKEITVHGTDAEKYLKQTNVSDADIISSIYVQRDNTLNGSNKVTIKTPKLISSVTQEGYLTPLTTAGVQNLAVIVATAPSRGVVTGAGALTGLYKALSDQGVKLNAAKIKVAQQELTTTTQIVKNAKAKDNDMSYSDRQKLDTQLATALAQIKTELAKYNNEELTTAQIKKIVDQVLQNTKLNNQLSSKDNDLLYQLAKLYVANKNNVLDANSIKRYKKLASTLISDLSKRWNTAVSSKEAQGFLAAIASALGKFFTGIGDALQKLF